MDNGELMCSECRGLGGKIDSDEADKMAELLIVRYLFEIQEAIALLERYRDFERGEARKRATGASCTTARASTGSRAEHCSGEIRSGERK